jgi:glutamate racemase
MKIGVFDSGVGGQSVASAIKTALPELEVELKEDREHLPYGNKTPDQLLSFTIPIFQGLIDDGCQVIVVACNTVTTNIINKLREHFTVPLVAIEPMVKPAAELTKTNVIAVCATPATLASERYNWLKDNYAQNVKVVEPDCSDWTMMIEDQAINRDQIASRINQALEQQADVIVLGCTHYHWIENEIKAVAKGRAKVLQPEPAIIKQLQQVLAQLG